MWPATSAAPTFFDPKRIDSERSSSGFYALVDGGVYANNPSMCAYVEGLTQWEGEKIVLASFGTGVVAEPIAYEEANNWGKAAGLCPFWRWFLTAWNTH